MDIKVFVDPNGQEVRPIDVEIIDAMAGLQRDLAKAIATMQRAIHAKTHGERIDADTLRAETDAFTEKALMEFASRFESFTVKIECSRKTQP